MVACKIRCYEIVDKQQINNQYINFPTSLWKKSGRKSQDNFLYTAKYTNMEFLFWIAEFLGKKLTGLVVRKIFPCPGPNPVFFWVIDEFIIVTKQLL